GVLVLIGLWIRLSISESPVFQQAPPEKRAPIVGVWRHHRKDVITAIGARLAENISFYLLTVFVITYAKTNDIPNSTVLNAVLISSAIHFITIPMWGALSDRVGRRPIYLAGAAGIGVWIFAFFPLIDTGNFLAITLAVTVGLLFHGMMYGPQAAFFSELFGTRMRYTGVSIGAQLSAIVAGALAPIIAVALLQRFSSSVPISAYLGLAALLTLAAVYAARETQGRDLAERIHAQ
ncbi:MAG TPA: MFS transporter, partial [Pseudonocardiaceae bacterium]|nr:MFS transporter [Pseudonocardiaceae bacterium]